MEESALEAMLTQTVTVARGETFTKQLSPDNADLTRDAIVKSLYEVRVLFCLAGKLMGGGNGPRHTDSVVRAGYSLAVCS